MKDFVKKFQGKRRGIEWSITVYLDDDAQYFAVCFFGAERFLTKLYSSLTMCSDAGCNLMAQKFAGVEVGV